MESPVMTLNEQLMNLVTQIHEKFSKLEERFIEFAKQVENLQHTVDRLERDDGDDDDIDESSSIDVENEGEEDSDVEEVC